MFSQISASASTSHRFLFSSVKRRGMIWQHEDETRLNDEHVLSVQSPSPYFSHTWFDFGLKKTTTTGVFEILMLETGKLISSILDSFTEETFKKVQCEGLKTRHFTGKHLMVTYILIPQ